MLIRIPEVLLSEEVAHCRTVLEAASWVDGKVTAGAQSREAKQNLQIPQNSEAARELGEIILRRLGTNPAFTSAALPLRVYPPLFNRYDEGMHFGTHIDNAIRPVPGVNLRVRTDLSGTLFLTAPEDYDGGELVIEDTYGEQRVKFSAGDMVLYPATSRHRVEAVTRGSRWCSFFWIQSMVRDGEARATLFDLDTAIQSLRAKSGESEEAVRLTGVYHNLLRRWAEV
ncbi:PKHD-type hydroxylase [Rhizomicrobium palustre]|uniref:PKHD-type hydroxylase n=1 Tax=Rhizomicrobium palustre TaxID=189966 RepID=A0A846N1M6_9PROT|nr:Fe2+-dependent dioxygenase [Rhizomicrobium palustre]NIK89646.1 PKHD-type hydroxylase [Rhizomicrobium palustre]